VREVLTALLATRSDFVVWRGREVDLNEARALGRCDLKKAALPLDVSDLIGPAHLMNVVRLVVEDEQVRKVLERLERSATLKAPVKNIQRVAWCGARS